MKSQPFVLCSTNLSTIFSGDQSLNVSFLPESLSVAKISVGDESVMSDFFGRYGWCYAGDNNLSLFSCYTSYQKYLQSESL